MDKEIFHTINVLESTKQALREEDVLKLRDLSNQTIHSACAIQDSGSLMIAVLVYALSKLIERKEYLKIKNWDIFVKKFNSFIDLAIKALKDDRIDKFESYLIMARNTLTSISINLKHAIQEVLVKASINKASRLHEHGISLGKTANLLGITQWELAEYATQKEYPIPSMDVKKRALMALEFLS